MIIATASIRTGGAMKLGHRLLWIEENMRAPGFQPPDFANTSGCCRCATMTIAAGRAPVCGEGGRSSDVRQFWKASSVREHLKDIHVPVYSVGGWYDNYVESDLDAFSTLSKTNQRTAS